jgi:hypothetical protein
MDVARPLLDGGSSHGLSSSWNWKNNAGGPLGRDHDCQFGTEKLVLWSVGRCER